MAFPSQFASPSASFASMASHDASAMEEPNSPSSSNQEASFTVSPDSSMQANGDEHQPRAEERERHPKGRRKRTNAKDRAVLEDAYSKNSKPDKNARLDIVNRVSLNEKEVQIWFQNRRQNDRRRSRPLSDQDLAAYRNGGIKIVSADGHAGISFSQHCEQAEHDTARSPAQTTSTTPTGSPDLGPWMPGKYHQFTMEVPLPAKTPSHPSVSRTPADASHHSASSKSFSFSQSGSFVSNQRWSTGAAFSTPSSFKRHTDGVDDSFRTDPFAPSSCSSAASAPVLPIPRTHSRSDSRSNSAVRLSMSLDGKATLVSPSPERASTTYKYDPRVEPIPISIPSLKRSGLNRSQSVTLPPISVLTGSLPCPGSLEGASPLPPRLTRGRSRDVHAWEFAADNGSDRDDELTQQAKDEASGSATAAISLLRTTSASAGSVRGSSPVLQPNGSKRNASVRPPLGPNCSGSAMQPFKRARLGRAQSSVARLQSPVSQFNVGRLTDHTDSTQRSTGEDRDGDDAGSVKKMDVSAMLSINGNESDKENWSPEGKDVTTTAPAAADRILPPVTFPSMSASRKPLPGGGLSNTRRNIFIMDGRRSPLSNTRAYTAPGGVRAARRGHKAGSSIEIFEDHEDDLRGEEEEMVTTEGRRAGGGGRRDDEIARFMSGEVSPSKKPDLDCITGLLSLSKGNWR
ncbi:hypothetical protein PpBr36_07729 [Pyricularia pennisetigena]|uniref:hypothetical protein n=1 Tax=Pyricularia pennisetigena TaxID=1578925 RepID=UPI00114ECE7A|nr:hypothetical protein PpBr36_07729 [Pyricularia pennisetigena]TLS26025.1 hypothetical protein PpBr36_07729 [Pyricularia pennisetigena]